MLGTRSLRLHTSLLVCLLSLLVSATAQDPMKTFDGNAGGIDCKFPFKYKGILYSKCTTIDNRGVPWCSVTADFDADGLWGRCDIRVPGLRTTGGNGGGANCVFPFQYKGETFMTCIYRDNRKPWCATTDNYPRDQQWGICVAFLQIPARGGNSIEQSECVFPFIYQGVQRSGCIVDPKDGSWCATTDDYDRDRRWAKCMITQSSAGICSNTYNLFEDKFSLNGSPVRWALTREECQSECDMRSSCVGFDFDKNPGTATPCNIHNDRRNFRLRNDGPNRDQYVVARHCATDCRTTYERLDNTLSYGGKEVVGVQTIPECSASCSAAPDCVGFDYDANQRASLKCFLHTADYNFLFRRSVENVVEFVVVQKVCSSVKTLVGNSNAPMCYFPYIYQGKLYSTCNSNNWHRPWCATTPNYDADLQWAECEVTAV